jgi:hypothetical protein
MMRLKDSEVQAIRRAVFSHFEPQAKVYLFGSIETNLQGTAPLRAKLMTMSDIQRAIGDRKIDIVTAAPELSTVALLIVSKAREQGIPL